MFGFIKRYQKGFFITTAFFICISIVFFGLLPKNVTKTADEVVFKTHQGKKIKRSQIEGLKLLLNTNNGEHLLFGQSIGMPFFAFDVFTDKVVSLGLLNQIALNKSKEFEPLWLEQLQREKRYKSYSHPQANFVNSEVVWAKHAPKIRDHLMQIKGVSDGFESFNLRAKLYLEEQEFSPFALWQFLQQQQASNQWVSVDEQLNVAQLSLFSYRTPKDWFGEKMLQYVSEAIFDISDYALKNGYQVTYRQAEDDLMKMNHHHFQQLQFLGFNQIKSEEDYFNEKLSHLGMNKMQMVSLWKNVLLLEHYLNEAASSLLLDSHTLQPFEEFAQDVVSVNRYQPPTDCIFESLHELGCFEAYLEKLGKPHGQLSLDFQHKPLDQIEQDCSWLIQQDFEIDYKEVNLTTAALSVAVQDVWKWKTNPKNARQLQAQFPQLEVYEDLQASQLQAAFNKLDSFSKQRVDQYVRELLLRDKSTWQSDAFEKEEAQSLKFSAQKNGANFPFKGLETFAKKKDFLEKFFSLSQDAQEFGCFSFDDRHFYQVLSVKELSKPKLVPYNELFENKVIHKILQSSLGGKRHGSQGKGMNLEQYLAPLKEAMDQHYKNQKTESDSFYLQCRLEPFMKQALEKSKEDPSQKVCVAGLENWELISKNETLVRHEHGNRTMVPLLATKEGGWSSVNCTSKAPEFLQVISKERNAEGHPMQKLIKMQIKKELLSHLLKEHLDDVQHGLPKNMNQEGGNHVL